MSDITTSSLLPGTYIIAVSGGVDSMVLLDILSRQPDIRLIVAHVDHGIRLDSAEDASFVANVSAKMGLTFEQERLQLGSNASEEKARTERYRFLRSCRKKYKANAIITAHHEDDVVETIILNIVRGTGWRGLASLRSTSDLIRPLLAVSKDEIIGYAVERGLQWRNDPTNEDVHYLRNYIRHLLLPQLDSRIRSRLLSLRDKQMVLRQEVEVELEVLSEVYCTAIEESKYRIDRYVIIMLPEKVGVELLQFMIEKVSSRRLLGTQAESLLIFAKSAKPNKMTMPQKELICTVTANSLIVEST